MFEALSATNEAIMRAKTRDELFEVVCEAAVLGGMFASATIAIGRSDGALSRHRRHQGRVSQSRRELAFRDVRRSCPKDGGSSAPSFRTRRPCVINELSHGRSSTHWHSKAPGSRDAIRRPLPAAEERAPMPSAFCCSLRRTKSTFTPDLIELLGRLAENVSFALDNFDRAEEKATDRGAEGAPDAHVRGAERHQRGDHAGQVAHRAVRAGVSGRIHRRQVHLDDHCAGQGRQRPARDRRGRRAVGRDHAERSPLHRRRPARGARHERHGVPHPAALCQQRLCQRQPCERLPSPSCKATARAPARRSR